MNYICFLLIKRIFQKEIQQASGFYANSIGERQKYISESVLIVLDIHDVTVWCSLPSGHFVFNRTAD